MAVNNPYAGAATFSTTDPSSLTAPSTGGAGDPSGTSTGGSVGGLTAASQGTSGVLSSLGIDPNAPSGSPKNAQAIALVSQILGVDLSNPLSKEGQHAVQNLTQAQIQLVMDEQKAIQARAAPGQNAIWTSADKMSAWGDAKYISTYGEGPWEAALNAAENFIGKSNWKVFPTQAMFNSLLSSGLDLNDQAGIDQYLANLLPPDIQKSMPWLGAGKTQTAYQDDLQKLQMAWFDTTGDTNAFNNFTQQEIDDMLRRTPSEMTAQWLQDPNLQSQYGWLKQGKTYEDMVTQYMNNPVEQAKVVARFGAGEAGDMNAYLQSLENPLQGPVGGKAETATTLGSARTAQSEAGRTPVG